VAGPLGVGPLTVITPPLGRDAVAGSVELYVADVVELE